MRLARKVVLHAPAWDSPLLAGFVERCLADGVLLLCVVGPDCERVHDVIDELVTGDGGDPDRGRDLLTTWHAGETVPEVLAFAEAMKPGEAGPVQEVRLDRP